MAMNTTENKDQWCGGMSPDYDQVYQHFSQNPQNILYYWHCIYVPYAIINYFNT